MSLDREITYRSLAGADLRGQPAPRPDAATAGGYYFPARTYRGPHRPPDPPPEARQVESLLKNPTPEHARKAERPFSEFVRSQQTKWASKARRPGRRGPRRPSLWLGKHEYPTWTIDGELVVVRDPERGSGRGSPIVRRPTDAERNRIFAADVLIETVIALYQGDSLGGGPVTRYMLHHDLAAALKAALTRALEVEQSATEPPKALTTPAPESSSVTPPAEPRRTKGTKTRFDPDGNFIVFAPAVDDELPDFAIALLPGVPAAFESRKQALRFIAKHERRGALPPECRVARVLARVKARPVFRQGFRMPRESWKAIAMIRKAPGVALPNLHLEWLPRYRQDGNGEWRPEEHKLRRTVRHGCREVLLEQLQEASGEVVQEIEERQLRESLGDVGATEGLVAGLEGSEALALRACRTLPQAVRDQLGLDGGLPDWSEVAERAQGAVRDMGHWIRAPFEFKAPADSRPRLHLVELEVGELGSLLERFGLEIEFWMIKDRVAAGPR